MITYIILAEALAISEDQIKRYGGALGVRDLGALEAALYRPQLKYYTSLVEEAAALWEVFRKIIPSLMAIKGLLSPLCIHF